MTRLDSIRADLVALLEAALPEATVFAAEPDDVLDTPAVIVGLFSLSQSLSLPGATDVSVTVTLIGARNDPAQRVVSIDHLCATAWDALGAARGVALPTAGVTALAQSAQPSSVTAAETSWPAVQITAAAVLPAGLC